LNILLPTDGSWAAYSAEQFAVDLCHRYGGKVIALHIYDPDISFESWKQRLKRELLAKMETERDALEIVDRVKKLGKENGVEVESVLKKTKGSPSDEIINYARIRDEIDLIVLAPRGKPHILKMFLGSTTEALIAELGRLLQVPILLVPKKE